MSARRKRYNKSPIYRQRKNVLFHGIKPSWQDNRVVFGAPNVSGKERLRSMLKTGMTAKSYNRLNDTLSRSIPLAKQYSRNSPNIAVATLPVKKMSKYVHGSRKVYGLGYHPRQEYGTGETYALRRSIPPRYLKKLGRKWRGQG
jgi:hypothetical protein